MTNERQPLLDPDLADRLAAAARSGDPEALARLYRAYGPALLAYLQRLLGDQPEAEDVLHETWLRLFSGRGEWEARGRLRSWLFTVADRLGRDRLRCRQRHNLLTPRLNELNDTLAPTAAETPSDAVHLRELLDQVENVLQDLPPAYALAFQLRIREEFTYAEIAAICGEPEGTLRSRVHYTIKQLRQALARSTEIDRKKDGAS